MKTKVRIFTLLAFIASYTVTAQFNQDEDFYASLFIDPTFTDKGFQFGVDITKELEWGFVSVSASTYPELKDGYFDIVGTPGLAFNFFESLTIYGGGRMGFVFRGGNVYPLVGMSLRFQVKIIDNVSIGLMFWVDHREDQKDEFYGDSDAYKEGLIFTGTLSQENGAGFLTILLN